MSNPPLTEEITAKRVAVGQDLPTRDGLGIRTVTGITTKPNGCLRFDLSDGEWLTFKPHNLVDIAV